MSLALLQSYSSEEEDAAVDDEVDSSDEGEEYYEDGLTSGVRRGHESLTGRLKADVEPEPSSDSSLPSAFDAFKEITGPPDFLNNMAAAPEETREALGVLDRRAERDRSRREKKELPSGAVVEAKPQLVGIRDRVRTDIDGASTAISGTAGAGKRVISATIPDKKDAADLLRVCLQCGVPKTFSHNRGMVCPICGDRPAAEQPKEPEKKKGSTVKDKEKTKRMRGQSSHATWKSETEMHLRQQFD